MLGAPEPRDYMICTGELRTVREFVKVAFEHVGLDYEKYVVVDEKFYRPVEKINLGGDPTEIRKDLGWEPEVSFSELVAKMVDHDLKLEEMESKK